MSRLYQRWPLPACGLLVVVFSAALSHGAPPVPRLNLVKVRLGEQWHIDHATHHVQGLCVSENFFWISSVERRKKAGWIFKVDRRQLKVVATKKLVDGPRFHPGGMQLVDNRIWVPLAEYRRHSTSKVLALNADTLAETYHFGVDDHLGAVAVDDQGNIYAANWDARQVHVFDRHGKRLRMIDTTTGVAYQDFEHHDGYLWGTGRAMVDGVEQSVVDVLDRENLTLRARVVLLGKTKTPGAYFAREGFSLFRKELYLMPEDGPNTRIYQFPPQATGLEELFR